MKYSPLRAPARAYIVHSAVIASILAVSAASLPGPIVPRVETVEAAAVQLSAQVATVDRRIVAPATGEVHFDEIKIKVTEPSKSGATFSSGLPASVRGNKVLEEAAKYVGTPYVWSGSSPSGFDCVGFVSYVYGRLGVSLPRTTGAYYAFGKRVSRSNARPGDIVVTPGHVAIYAGGNMVIEASVPGTVVRFRTMWQKDPVFVRVTKDSFWD